MGTEVSGRVNESAGGTNAQEWVEKDRKYLWHHMQPYAAAKSPMVVTQGTSATIRDLDGNEYIDAMSGLWCVNLGYSEKELADAAYQQMIANAVLSSYPEPPSCYPVGGETK